MDRHLNGDFLSGAIESALEDAKLGQEEFAELTGLADQSVVSRMVNGKRKWIDDDLLQRIAQATGKPLKLFLDAIQKDKAKRSKGVVAPDIGEAAAAGDATGPLSAAGRVDIPDRPQGLRAIDVPQEREYPDRRPPTAAEYVRNLDFSRVKHILIFALTGDVTVRREFLEALEQARPKPGVKIHCRVLLRSPFSTDSEGNGEIDRAIAELKRFRRRFDYFSFEVRFYASPTPFQAVMCEHNDVTFSGWLAWYTWGSTDSREMAAARHPILADDGNEMLSVYAAWFSHFWGSSEKRQIHTILFDFDNTLFFTVRAQVKGWAHAIETGLEDSVLKITDLEPKFAKAWRAKGDRDKAGREKLVTDIFLGQQDEESIAKSIFSEKFWRSGKKAALQRLRNDKRDELTLTLAEPMEGVLSDIRTLRQDYRLVIVSATSEALVREVLGRHSLDFSYVLGKEALRQRTWQSVASKAQHFIRVSGMLGIPLERMVFVGDSDADYQAARQLGLHFIENRSHGKSLIRPPAVARYCVKDPNAPGELIAQIEAIEAELAKAAE